MDSAAQSGLTVRGQKINNEQHILHFDTLNVTNPSFGSVIKIIHLPIPLTIIL